MEFCFLWSNHDILRSWNSIVFVCCQYYAIPGHQWWLHQVDVALCFVFWQQRRWYICCRIFQIRWRPETNKKLPLFLFACGFMIAVCAAVLTSSTPCATHRPATSLRVCCLRCMISIANAQGKWLGWARKNYRFVCGRILPHIGKSCSLNLISSSWTWYTSKIFQLVNCTTDLFSKRHGHSAKDRVPPASATCENSSAQAGTSHAGVSILLPSGFISDAFLMKPSSVGDSHEDPNYSLWTNSPIWFHKTPYLFESADL